MKPVSRLRAKSPATRPGVSEPSAVERVVAKLMDLILGELAPGRKLPSEAELARQYAVSRLTIREAVKMLAGRGLLEVSRGKRAVVRQPDGSAFGDFLMAAMKHDAKGLFDLVEVRHALEIQSATLSANRANRAGLAAIEAALDGMREAAGRMKRGPDKVAAEHRFHDYDVGFHEALALSSGNRMLAYLLEAMAGPLRESFHLSMRGHRLRGRGAEETIAAHEKILEGVKSGDGRGAGQAMRAHLRDAERDIRAALNSGPAGRKA
jgi:GntR family transcriptional regulator, transcriptional repressor for pyruvate dehydrogenase complex